MKKASEICSGQSAGCDRSRFSFSFVDLVSPVDQGPLVVTAERGDLQMNLFRRIGRKIIQFIDRDVLRFLSERQLEAYSSSKPFVRKWLARPYHHLHRAIFTGLKMRKMHMVYASGTSKDGLSLRVAFMMSRQSRLEFQSQLFEDGNVTIEERNTCPSWQYPQKMLCAAEDVDLVLVEHSTLQRWEPPYGEWVTTAPRVRMVFEFQPGETWGQVEHRLHQMAWNIKLVKRAGYSFEISHEEADLAFFYDRMYSPYIHLRHKEMCVIEKPSTLKRKFDQGFLAFVCDTQGNRVAGELCKVHGDVCFGVVNGILDGDEQWLEKRALCAMYYFTIRWCYEHQYRRYDMGPCFPFENDGIYVHKKRWGFTPSVELGMSTSWLLWAPRPSQAAQNYMHARPFISSIAKYSRKELDQVSPAFSSEAEG